MNDEIDAAENTILAAMSECVCGSRLHTELDIVLSALGALYDIPVKGKHLELMRQKLSALVEEKAA
jgi:hypothetical protein